MITSRCDRDDATEIRRHRGLASPIVSPSDDRSIGLQRQTVVAPCCNSDDATQIYRNSALINLRLEAHRQLFRQIDKSMDKKMAILLEEERQNGHQ